jgi:hypothetical protein
MSTNVFKPTACLGESMGQFHLFFYSPRDRGIQVYGSCRARGIANILLIFSSFIEYSPASSPGPLIIPRSNQI